MKLAKKWESLVSTVWLFIGTCFFLIRCWPGAKMKLPKDCSTSLTASNIVRWVSFLLILTFLLTTKWRTSIRIVSWYFFLHSEFWGYHWIELSSYLLGCLGPTDSLHLSYTCKRSETFFAIFSQFWTPFWNMNVFIRWTQMPIRGWPVQSDKGTHHKGSQDVHIKDLNKRAKMGNRNILVGRLLMVMMTLAGHSPHNMTKGTL